MTTAPDARRPFTPAERHPLPWHRPSAAAFWQAVAGLWSRQKRRWRATAAPHAGAPDAARGREAAQRVANHLVNELAAIRGYCELTRMSHPDDETLVRRMDEATATCSEAADSIHQLLCLGGQRSP